MRSRPASRRRWTSSRYALSRAANARRTVRAATGDGSETSHSSRDVGAFDRLAITSPLQSDLARVGNCVLPKENPNPRGGPNGTKSCRRPGASHHHVPAWSAAEQPDGCRATPLDAGPSGDVPMTPYPYFDLNGKVALVTGGSRGLG